MQLSALKATTDWHLYVVPFLCALPNIITLNSSFKENRVVGYEYVIGKARKYWWVRYENGDLVWNLKYWSERYVKKYSTQNMRNCRQQYMKQIALACTTVHCLIKN